MNTLARCGSLCVWTMTECDGWLAVCVWMASANQDTLGRMGLCCLASLKLLCV